MRGYLVLLENKPIIVIWQLTILIKSILGLLRIDLR